MYILGARCVKRGADTHRPHPYRPRLHWGAEAACDVIHTPPAALVSLNPHPVEGVRVRIQSRGRHCDRHFLAQHVRPSRAGWTSDSCWALLQPTQPAGVSHLHSQPPMRGFKLGVAWHGVCLNMC
eukprot:359047-Chlamydomonas_euryale.AAC.10